MTNLQIDLLWEEVSQIQHLYSLFILIFQIKYIQIQKKGKGNDITFLEGYNLPTTITHEIQLAFKLASDIHFE